MWKFSKQGTLDEKQSRSRYKWELVVCIIVGYLLGRYIAPFLLDDSDREVVKESESAYLCENSFSTPDVDKPVFQNDNFDTKVVE